MRAVVPVARVVVPVARVVVPAVRVLLVRPTAVLALVARVRASDCVALVRAVVAASVLPERVPDVASALVRRLPVAPNRFCVNVPRFHEFPL